MYKYGAKLLRVVDGDTADVMIDLGFDTWVKARLRFKGVDTWEKRTRDLAEKAKGIAASEFTKKYLEMNDGKFTFFATHIPPFIHSHNSCVVVNFLGLFIS